MGATNADPKAAPAKAPAKGAAPAKAPVALAPVAPISIWLGLAMTPIIIAACIVMYFWCCARSNRQLAVYSVQLVLFSCLLLLVVCCFESAISWYQIIG